MQNMSKPLRIVRLRLLKKRENRDDFLCNFSILLNRSSQTRINRHFFFEDIQQKNVPDDTQLKWVRSTCGSPVSETVSDHLFGL